MIEYQFAREKRENQLKDQYNAQGITSNYPQYTTNFWGNAANNYGFGMTNIADNIANLPKVMPVSQATAVPQRQVQNNAQPQQTVQPQIWETAADGKKKFMIMLLEKREIINLKRKVCLIMVYQQ